jgi:hypothetical protein
VAAPTAAPAPEQVPARQLDMFFVVVAGGQQGTGSLGALDAGAAAVLAGAGARDEVTREEEDDGEEKAEDGARRGRDRNHRVRGRCRIVLNIGEPAQQRLL